jgi:hypothetical protein
MSSDSVHSLFPPFIQNTYISSHSLNYNLNYNYYPVASYQYQQPGQYPVYPPIGAPPTGQPYGEQQQHHHQPYVSIRLEMIYVRFLADKLVAELGNAELVISWRSATI